MDPIEQAIRTALEKGDAEDAEFRARIYRSVEAALDRVIQANPQLTVEKAIARRRQLQQKIAEIETEFAPALPADDPAAIDADLDHALLDILERSPAETRGGEPHPGPPAARPVPAPAGPDTPRFAASEPVAPPSISHDGPDIPSPELDAIRSAPARQAPAVEPGGRREPVFSPFDASPSAGGRAEPVIGDGRFSAVARRGDAAAPSVAPPVEAPHAPRPSGPRAEVPRRPIEPAVDLGAVPENSPRRDPDLDFPAVPQPLYAPDISAPVPQSPPEIVAADRAARSRERRRPFAAVFFGIALLSLAAVGIMFAYQTGLLTSPEERDTSVPNPSAAMESEDFDPSSAAPPTLGTQPAARQDWISVFVPGGAATAPGGATAEAMQDDSGTFLRIRSGAGGSAVSFDVEQEVLEQLAGKSAIFNIIARGEEGQQTEMSVECNFGELGDCGRKRYEVGYEKGEFLFEITFPDTQPGSSGTIAINSDFSGQGRAIDVYEIRAAAQ